jgi:hypothetical protein
MKALAGRRTMACAVSERTPHMWRCLVYGSCVHTQPGGVGDLKRGEKEKDGRGTTVSSVTR